MLVLNALLSLPPVKEIAAFFLYNVRSSILELYNSTQRIMKLGLYKDHRLSKTACGVNRLNYASLQVVVGVA